MSTKQYTAITQKQVDKIINSAKLHSYHLSKNIGMNDLVDRLLTLVFPHNNYSALGRLNSRQASYMIGYLMESTPNSINSKLFSHDL
jgi:hypothetical protein